MADSDSDSGQSKPIVWIGVAASVVAILTWLGISNPGQVKDWLTGHPATPSPSPSPTASPSMHRAPDPVAPSSPPVMIPDPGCTEADHILRSALASFTGGPDKITPTQAQRYASEFRGTARSLDQAATDASDLDVRSAIDALAADMRTIADDYDAYDIEGTKRVPISDEIGALSDACRDAPLVERR